jgi:hypothetical protein
LTKGRAATFVTTFLLAFMACQQALASEIYHWIDENGVANFSQLAPADRVKGVSKMALADSAPADHDPEEDLYDVKGQAERMAALWEERDKRREELREQQRKAAPQKVVYIREPPRYTTWPFGYPPYQRPPPKPELPIERPMPSVPYRPPGQTAN